MKLAIDSGMTGAALALTVVFAACGNSSDNAGAEQGAAGAAGAGRDAGHATGGGGSNGNLIEVPDGNSPSTVTPDGACDSVSQEAENQRQAADIIIAIDTSGSMTEEIAFVQQNLNAFSQQITAANVDAHVVLIARRPMVVDEEGEGELGICIDPPLGSGGCPTMDTKLPSYFHLDEAVESNDALERIQTLYPQYQSALRPKATKHVVVVTDDNALADDDTEAEVNPSEFITSLKALDPAFEGFKFHGIYAYSSPGYEEEMPPTPGDPCNEIAAAEGTVYRQLVKDTGGVSGNLCLQDFKPVFDELAKSVVGNAKLACEWAIPAPPSGKTFEPSQTNVSFTGSDTPKPVPFVDSAAGCATAKDGWAYYFDDPSKPTKVLACPQTCTTIQADTKARIDIYFGCPTIVAPPT